MSLFYKFLSRLAPKTEGVHQSACNFAVIGATKASKTPNDRKLSVFSDYPQTTTVRVQNGRFPAMLRWFVHGGDTASRLNGAPSSRYQWFVHDSHSVPQSMGAQLQIEPLPTITALVIAKLWLNTLSPLFFMSDENAWYSEIS